MIINVEYKRSDFLKTIIIIVMICCTISCSNNSSVVSENNYSAKIVGRWIGTAGSLKETMTLNSDFTFSCSVYPAGFIANTLSEGESGTISGEWQITDQIITLKITDVKNKRIKNKVTKSIIISLKDNELILKSDRGETSRFERVKF